MKAEELLQKRIAVFGAARSGIAVAQLLQGRCAYVCLLDQKDPVAASSVSQEMSSKGIPCFWGEECARALDNVDVLVKSPGIPQENDIVVRARNLGIRIVSEIEIAAAFVPAGTKIVAVTGTNGKTTTTAWIAHLLHTAGFPALACGNIGRAFSDAVSEVLVTSMPSSTPRFLVAEISSFQLEDIEDFRPDIAVLTNLAPDHLDRYPSYQHYIAAKENLLRNMSTDEAFVWNAENKESISFAAQSPVRRYAFCASEASLYPSAAFVRAGEIILEVNHGQPVSLVRAGDLPLVGKHNLENAMAAALAAYLAGASPDALREGLLSFKGVEHRIEFCGEVDGVRFYNDSKATNLDSLEKALLSFTAPVTLIAGGRDKKSDYSQLNALVKERVKRLITIGEAAALIEKAWAELVPTERASDMEDAVRRAAEHATSGDVVLLSPACASYDMYSNYEERGRHFKSCVANLIASRQASR